MIKNFINYIQNCNQT